VKLVRTLLIALALSLALGLAIGTALRLRMERATQYIGRALPLAPLPLDVGDAGAGVLHPRHHEEPVG
jgi:hypothetical protein